MIDNLAVIVFDVNETLSDMSPMADRFADVGQGGVNRFAQDSGARRDRIDRDHAIAGSLQIGHDAMAGPVRLGAGADQRDGFRVAQQAP